MFETDERKKGDVIYLKNIIDADLILYQTGVITDIGYADGKKYLDIKLIHPESELGRPVRIFKSEYSGTPYYDFYDNDYDIEVIARGCL